MIAAKLPGPVRRTIHFETSPLLVFYEITRSCDLVCLHCRACAQRDPAPNELSTPQSRALIAQIAEFPNPPLLVFTGGDPFKRSDLPNLVKHATEFGLEVAVTPSATPLVTPQALETLKAAGAARIAVSLDGPDPASHDGFRGVSGSFPRTLEIIADARRLGLPVQVNTAVTPGNWLRIEEFASLLETLDIVLCSVFFLVPVGRPLKRLTIGVLLPCNRENLAAIHGERYLVKLIIRWLQMMAKGFCSWATTAISIPVDSCPSPAASFLWIASSRHTSTPDC
jgi:MoaA/NifB/PqqE/SkfB family radical SAM enzyme